LSINVHR